MLLIISVNGNPASAPMESMQEVWAAKTNRMVLLTDSMYRSKADYMLDLTEKNNF